MLKTAKGVQPNPRGQQSRPSRSLVRAMKFNHLNIVKGHKYCKGHQKYVVPDNPNRVWGIAQVLAETSLVNMSGHRRPTSHWGDRGHSRSTSGTSHASATADDFGKGNQHDVETYPAPWQLELTWECQLKNGGLQDVVGKGGGLVLFLTSAS